MGRGDIYLVSLDLGALRPRGHAATHARHMGRNAHAVGCAWANRRQDGRMSFAL
jgi:hypothetical protein